MSSHSSELKINLIKAGAGAGKTTVLINTLIDRILQYHAKTNKFPKVAVSTFTRKATRELKERIIIKALELKNQELIHYVSYSHDLQISTLHGIFNNFIKSYGYIIDLSPGITLMNSKQEDILFMTVLKDILFEQKIGTPLLDHYSFEELIIIVKKYILHIQMHYKANPPTKKQVQDILNIKKLKLTESLSLKHNTKDNQALLELQNEESNLDTFNDLYIHLQNLGKHILPKWLQLKKETSQMTLNDLEIFTLKILKKQKNISFLQNNNWDFWFLDEYQDTSPLQKDILNILSQNSRVFIVGDPQQSIYYFRGSDSSVFLQKEEEVKKSATSDIQYLNTNYRSCPELVSFLNDFFDDKNFKKMEPINNNFDNKKEVAQFILLNTNLTKKHEKQEQELHEVQNRIDSLLKQGNKPEEIAILCRQNKALFLTAQYLKNKNYLVHLQTTGNFHNRREIIDALFLLRFILNPHNDENLIGLLRTPYCRVLDNTLVSNRQKIHNEQSLWNYFLQITPILPIIQKLKYSIEQAHKIGIIQSFQKALEDFNFIDLSYYQDPTGVREANLWKLIYCLKSYTSTNNCSDLSSFVDSLFYENLQLPLDQMNYSQNALSATQTSGVQLMTIHTAKGLEFKHVILIQVCSGLKHTDNLSYFIGDKQTGDWTLSVKCKTEDKKIKSIFSKTIKEKENTIEMQEFDRLLYVAITRAQKTITFIGSGKPEKNSWRIRFSFFNNLITGEHKLKNYSYFVK